MCDRVRLTIFTVTYNRCHTLPRLYESLCRQSCSEFNWLVIDDGSVDNTDKLIAVYSRENRIPIRYVRKENGGLHTGYNIAYSLINTELSMCVDSDDYLADDAVEVILKEWKKRGSDKYAGLIGLDYDIAKNQIIGGPFPNNMYEVYFLDLYTKRIHIGDTKLILRTKLLKRYSPQIGFPGEKCFNPVYVTHQVCDIYPLIVLNHVICNVEYQSADSMSKSIFHQYWNNPKSFAKTRLMEMSLNRSTFFNNIRSCVHYVSSCIIAKDKNWLRNTPRKLMTLSMAPLGLILYFYIRYKNHA